MDETVEYQSGKGNYDFVQLSKGYLKAMRALARKNPLAHEILYYFVEHMGKNTNAVVCSYKVLQEVMCVSRPTIGRAIKVLKDDNWIDAVKVGNATAYCVNAKVFWQSARNNKKYAMFQATVIASETEQENGYFKNNEKLTYIPTLEKDDIVSVGNENLPPPDQHEMDV